MLLGQDRDELRRMYADAWRKHRDGKVLSLLEAQIARVVEEHPEYHGFMSDETLDTEFTPEGGQSNPYLHMGLHLSIREQVATDRPPGIRTVFDALASRCGDALDAEHRMMECLAETLWESQRDNLMPDEQRYLERLRALL
jgi:hypothetical protein